MYVRQVKQFLKNAVDGFDEKHYGFATVVDLLRAAGKAGVLRVERDRQGAVRVFAGPKLTALSSAEPVEAAAVATGEAEPVAVVPAPELPVADTEAVAAAPKKRVRQRKSVKTKSAKAADAVSKAAKPAGRGRKATKQAKPRARRTVRAKPVAADVSE
jgi:hypothetical protein